MFFFHQLESAYHQNTQFFSYDILIYSKSQNHKSRLDGNHIDSYQFLKVKMASKSHRKKTMKGKRKNNDNPWTYQQNLTFLLETDKLSRDELLTLTCRDKYCIKSMMFKSPKDRDDELYWIFGDLVGQTVDFMRCWL